MRGHRCRRQRQRREPQSADVRKPGPRDFAEALCCRLGLYHRVVPVIVAVPFEAVDELESQGLATAVQVFRGGTAMEAVLSVGMDSAALVTLIQAPDAIRAFAAWVRDGCSRSGDKIDIVAKRGDRRVRLTVDGDVDVAIVADFIAAAFGDPP